MSSRIMAVGMVLPSLCFGLLVGAGGVDAKALRVPDEYSRIQTAMLVAQHGDTVLVSPGRYRGPVDLRNGVVLRSSDGPDVTTISGSRWWVVRMADADTFTALVGFTVTGGRGADRVVYCSGGGSPRVLGNTVENGWYGICCEGASPILRGNVVRSNKQGILCKVASPLIVNNHITRNYSGIVLEDGSPRILRNTIDLNGTGIEVQSWSLPTIGGSIEEANDIYDNRSYDLVNRGLVKDDAIRTQEPLLLEAKYNFWGSNCPDRSKLVGQIVYAPWVNEDHTERFTSCPKE